MSEIREEKRRGPWSTVLHTVKGDDTAQLVERFTAEMTLVAEGLVEDQTKLRGAVDRLTKDQDRASQHADASVQVLESSLRELREDTDARLSAMESRLAALEKQQKAAEDRRQKQAKDGHQGLLRQVTVLVGMVCATVIVVAVLRLFA